MVEIYLLLFSKLKDLLEIPCLFFVHSLCSFDMECDYLDVLRDLKIFSLLGQTPQRGRIAFS